MTKVLIGGDEGAKVLFCHSEQIAIIKFGPSHFISSGDFVIGKRMTQRGRCAVVEKNSHAPIATNLHHREALPGVFQNGFHLFTCHTRKPFKKIVHRRAAFEVLEQRRHRHACALEQTRAADFARHTFNRRTSVPIKHGKTITPRCNDSKRKLAREHGLNASSPCGGTHECVRALGWRRFRPADRIPPPGRRRRTTPCPPCRARIASHASPRSLSCLPRRAGASRATLPPSIPGRARSSARRTASPAVPSPKRGRWPRVVAVHRITAPDTRRLSFPSRPSPAVRAREFPRPSSPCLSPRPALP